MNEIEKLILKAATNPEQIKMLAKKFLDRIEETRPDKTKTAYEQANEEQKKCIEMFRRAADTGKVEL